MANAEQRLSYVSSNDNREISIVFLHGAFSGTREFAKVASHLPDHHLIIPNLPSHGPSTCSSRSITPLTLQSTSELLAELIHRVAKSGRAHVVGLSLGAHIALHLAATHPDVVLTVFATGYNRFSPSIWGPVLPYIVWGERRVEALIPTSVIKYLMNGIDLDVEENESDPGPNICTLQLCRDVLAILVSKAALPAVPARALIVAATRKGLVPTDSVDDARLALQQAGSGNASSRAVQMPDMMHPWDMQAPQLFADCVRKWINDENLAKEMVAL